MRARNIKPGFFKNEALVECSFPARLLYPGLWMLADREGRLENRPRRIKMELFPADNVDVGELLGELEEHGLILLYQAGGVDLIWIPGFEQHQAPHCKECASSLPAHPHDVDPDWTPPGKKSGSNGASTVQARCKHGVSTVSAPPDSLIPDSLIPDSRKAEDSLRSSSASPEPRGDSGPAAEQVILFPLVGKQGEHAVTREDLAEYQAAYPAVDVPQELREMRAWCLANPTRRKTRKGVRRFIVDWLAREQDKGGAARASPRGRPPTTASQRDRWAEDVLREEGPDG